MKLSVALCTYNGSNFISQQLESIINQTIKVDEIIICDDCSTDNTVSIIESFQVKYPNLLTLYQNESNLRVNKNFEKAISLCKGDYIFLSDQDDLWKKEKVEKIMSHFIKNPLIEALFSNGDLIDEKNQKLDGILWSNILFFNELIVENIDLYYYISNARNMVTGATLCIKKEIKDFILPIPDSKVMYHDEWIALNLSFRKTISFINENLISYRVHSAQQIGVIKASSLKKNLNVIESILNSKTNNTYRELIQIRKSYKRNYKKFKKLKDNFNDKILFDIDQIIDNNKQNIINTEKEMKKSNFLFFYFDKLIKHITNKKN